MNGINGAAIAIVSIGILVPAIFTVFVFSVTRRPRESHETAELNSRIAKLRKDLHRNYAAGKAGGQ